VDSGANMPNLSMNSVLQRSCTPHCIANAVVSSFRRFLAAFTHDIVKIRWNLDLDPKIQSHLNLAPERKISPRGHENHDFHVTKRGAHGSKGTARGPSGKPLSMCSCESGIALRKLWRLSQNVFSGSASGRLTLVDG